MSDKVIKIKKDRDGNPIVEWKEAYLIVEKKQPFTWDGNFFYARASNGEKLRICNVCSLDSLCDKKMRDICTQLEFFTGKYIIIHLLSRKRIL